MTNKILKFASVSAIALAALLVGATASKAETASPKAVGLVSVSAEANDDSSAKSSGSLKSSVDVGASVSGSASDDDAKASAEDEAGFEATSRDSATGKASGAVNAKVNLPVDVSVTSNADWEGGAITIGRGDVEEENDNANSTSTVAVSLNPIQVKTVADLKVFAGALVKSDDNIKSVKIGPESSEVSYAYSGKFLGVFSIRPVVRAIINADGTVSLKKPWYDIFVKKTTEIDVDETELQSDVNASVNASVGASASALAKEAASLKGAIASLKANQNSAIQASSTASVSVN